MWEILPPPPDWVAPEETGNTYEENALLKARSLADHVGAPAIADDSGIEMLALGGAPGVRSARFAGENATDEENLEKLLAAARETPEGQRGARYVCVAVFLVPGQEPVATHGAVDGCIVLERRGTGGFGYDPIFGLLDSDRTMAELTPEEKDEISHRGRAFRALRHLIDRS